MIIDGSYGEGGGQSLRTAVALACLTGRKIVVENIRKGRKQPGLKPQHMAGIRVAAQMCSAEVEGLEPRSTRLSFAPGEIKSGDYRVDIGTAGSITLLLQTVLPIMLSFSGPGSIEIRGGTDVSFAPTIDYYRRVLFPILNAHGARIDAEVLERGYYPEGGGLVRVRVAPDAMGRIEILERGVEREKIAWFNSRALPEHIGARIKKTLNKEGIKTVNFDVRSSGRSRGCSLLLTTEFSHTIFGADVLCRRGVPAEKIAMRAVSALNSELRSRGTVDSHMADHLPVFAFLSGAVAYIPAKWTEHLRTNLWLVKQFGAEVIEKDRVEVHAYI